MLNTYKNEQIIQNVDMREACEYQNKVDKIDISKTN